MDQRLFSGVPWSTSRVLAETRARLRLLAWRWEELPSTRDVDLPEDLDWLLAGRLLDAEARAMLLHYSKR